MSGELSYKTHILIGVRPKGVMTVIADWPPITAPEFLPAASFSNFPLLGKSDSLAMVRARYAAGVIITQP